MNTLEMAQAGEVELCYKIIDMGRQYQKEQGFVQWTDDYPNIYTVRDDVKNGKGYVVKADDRIAGYMCIDFNGEPAYEEIQGQWQTQEPYAVVHRMAFSKEFRGLGLADVTFSLIEELCVSKGIRCIRIDTDFPNKRMQHILEKNGFKYCGIIRFQGSEKLAYDKTW